MNKKCYSELCKLRTFDERLAYLFLGGTVGSDTFGSLRYLNQSFYTSTEWKSARRKVVIRDLGFDLGVKDVAIDGNIYVHHINPITPSLIESNSYLLLDPENLICASYSTHKFIHFGIKDDRPTNIIIERKPYDTCPWKA